MRHYIYGLLMVGALGWAGAVDKEAKALNSIRLSNTLAPSLEGVLEVEISMEDFLEADAKAGRENTLSPESRDGMRASYFNTAVTKIHVIDDMIPQVPWWDDVADWSGGGVYTVEFIGWTDGGAYLDYDVSGLTSFEITYDPSFRSN